MRETALSYAKRGWHVLPCKPRSKQPATRHGLKDASTDPKVINGWWAQAPDANVAIRCGIISAGLVVIDVDGEEGKQSLMGKKLPPTVIAQTGGGGWHYLYWCKTRLRPKVGLLPKVDLRAEDSYIVAPPSVHPSGAEYSWLFAPEDHTIAELPEWVVNLAQPAIEMEGLPEEPIEATELPNAGRIGRAALDFIANGAPVGMQRDRALAAARNLLEAGYPVKETAKRIWAGLKASPSEPNREPWTPQDALKIAQDLAIRPARPLAPRANGKGPVIESAADLLSREFPPVKWVVDGIIPEGLTILAAKSKIGKAQPLDAKVLTPNGWREMGTLRVGDEVISRNGIPTLVTGIYPQGVEQCYEVKMSDETSVEASGEHLWQTQSQMQRWLGHSRLMTTNQIMDAIAKGKTRLAYIPMTNPVQFAQQDTLPVDPYLLGLLLGDGSFTKGISFNSRDQELFDEVANRLPADMTTKLFPKGYDISLRSKVRKVHVKSSLQLAFIELGIANLKSATKFIPGRYKLASVPDRLALLRGLMDTDGWNQGRSVQFCTVSPQLAVDIQFLIESLGGCATLKKKEKNGYYGKDGFVQCRPSYIITFRLPADLGCPFSLQRKANEWLRYDFKTRRPPLRRIISVTPSRTTATQCISVADPSGLYLTEHCIVTHNTWLCLDVALATAYGGMAFGNRKVDQSNVLYMALEDGPRRVQQRLKMFMEQMPEVTVPTTLRFAFQWPRMDEGGFDYLIEDLKDNPDIKLVVVDTLQRIRPREKGSRTLYAQDYAAIAPLADLAHARNVSIIVVMHTRKMGADDKTDMISGTTGISGAADHILILERARNQGEATMHLTGRDVEEEQLALLWKAPCWELLGEAKEVKMSKERKEVVEFIEFGKGVPVTPKDVADKLGKDIKQVRSLMWKMAQDGTLMAAGGFYSLSPQLTQKPEVLWGSI